jgi:hypothetical protein
MTTKENKKVEAKARATADSFQDDNQSGKRTRQKIERQGRGEEMQIFPTTWLWS